MEAGFGGQGLEFSIYGWFRIENDFKKGFKNHIVSYQYNDPDSNKFLPIFSVQFYFNKTINQHKVVLELTSPVGNRKDTFFTTLDSSSSKDWAFFHISHSHIIEKSESRGDHGSSGSNSNPNHASHRMLKDGR